MRVTGEMPCQEPRFLAWNARRAFLLIFSTGVTLSIEIPSFFLFYCNRADAEREEASFTRALLAIAGKIRYTLEKDTRYAHVPDREEEHMSEEKTVLPAEEGGKPVIPRDEGGKQVIPGDEGGKTVKPGDKTTKTGKTSGGKTGGTKTGGTKTGGTKAGGTKASGTKTGGTKTGGTKTGGRKSGGTKSGSSGGRKTGSRRGGTTNTTPVPTRSSWELFLALLLSVAIFAGTAALVTVHPLFTFIMLPALVYMIHCLIQWIRSIFS